MTINDALQILKLEPGATEEQIEAAFIQLSQSTHPDTGGSVEAFIRLTEARDTALRSVTQSTLVPVEAVRDLIALFREERHDQQREREKARKREEAIVESRRVSANVIMTQTRRYRELRRRVAVWGSIVLAVTVLQTNIIPTLDGILPDWPILSVALILVSAFFAVRVWVYKTVADDLKGSVEDLTERLSERSYYLDMIYRTIPDTSKPYVTEWDWYQGIENWVEQTELNYEEWEDDERKPHRIRQWLDRTLLRLRLWRWRYRAIRLYRSIFGYRLKMTHEVARMIGYTDFRRLLIAKGTELDLIEARETRLHNRRQIVYAPAPFPESDS